MAENLLYVSKERVATLKLAAVQADNLTPLKVVFEDAENYDPTAGFRIDWERSNGSQAFIGSWIVQAVTEIELPDVLFSHEGEIKCQVIVLVDGGELWHSSIARARLPRAIQAEVAATPDARRYVEVPSSFIEGNLTTYSPASGRLIDTGVSLAYFLTLYDQIEYWYNNPESLRGPRGYPGKSAYEYAVENGWLKGEPTFGEYLANTDKLMYDTLRSKWITGVVVTQAEMENMIANETTDPDTMYFVRLPEDI